MIIDYTRKARGDLDEIWNWNAGHYGRAHADAYITFLQLKTELLCSEYARGRAVPSNPEYRYRIIQKRKKRHGHIVVYEILADTTVRILRFLHTAQDWQEKLKKEFGRE
jgi:plasmid stabilization system protein ParE